MIEIDRTLKKHELKTTSYHKKGKTVIIDSNRGKLVLKPKSNQKIYNYLNSRSFDYYPKSVIEDDEYDITNYIEEPEMPAEQKLADLAQLVAMLHNKTTYYQTVDLDDYKKNYEELSTNIDYLKHYYDDIMTVIESKTYMSPAELLLARNISIIFGALEYSKNELDNWYELVKDNKKRRYVVLHNNLELDHFIRGKNSYLISWDKSTIDIPIYDIYKLYKKYCLDFDFEPILRTYENNYPLLEEERRLLYVLISIPDKLDFNSSIYDTCSKITDMIDYLYRTENIVLPKDSKETKYKE